MKILYAIQGTGNGHLSRAKDIIPRLQRRGEVDLLVSGCQADIQLPYQVVHKFDGLSFIFGKKGGIDYYKTYRKAHVRTLFNDISKLPIDDYDLVINDFEPVSAWACYLKNKPCIGLSHQLAVINKKAPHPNQGDLIGKAILKYYAPVTAKYGFHFLPYNNNIFTPVIREEVRKAFVQNKGHYTVYLPAYGDAEIINMLACFPEIEWQVFSKHNQEDYRRDHITIQPVQAEKFLESFVSAEGILCGAGFETPAEALFLRKKLMVIPMKGQYEQQCNAAALKALGVPVLKNLKTKHIRKVQDWLKVDAVVDLEFPDQTDSIIDLVIQKHAGERKPLKVKQRQVETGGKFRELVLKKIFKQIET